jgi:hypothetical protein
MSKPSREQRLAQAADAARLKMETQRKHLAAIQAQQKAAAKKLRDRRRYRVGAMADEAGLLVWSDADLAAVCAVLAQLKDVPHPAAVLEALLEDGCGMPSRSVAMASPIGDGVSRAD